MAVDAAGRDDLALAGDDLGPGTDNDVDAGLNVGISRLADSADLAGANAEIGFDDAPMIQDDGIRDNRVDRALGSDALPLPKKPRLTGRPSAACSMRARCHGPGVQVVAAVPAAGPVPPPSIVVMPL